MKKIGFFVKGYPRLSETFIAQEILLLEKKGYPIAIFSLKGAREKTQQSIVAQIKATVTYLPEGKNYYFDFFKSHSLLLLSQPVAYLRSFMTALSLKIFAQSAQPFKRFTQAVYLVANKIIDRETFQHLHSHFMHDPTEVTYFISKLTGITYSISAHAIDIYTLPQKVIRERVAASQFLMTCTTYNWNFLRSLDPAQSAKIHRVYHGIDLARFLPTPISLSLKPVTHLLSVGRLVEKKGYKTILQALKILKDRGLSFHYTIVGEGDESAEIKQLCQQLGLSPHVTFTGAIPQEKILEVMKIRPLFICGSEEAENGDRDGIPNTLAEAMAMQLPIVATLVSGIPELCEHNVNSLLVPQRSPQEMANSIQTLIDDPALAERLALQSRQTVEQKFNAVKCIEECDQLLRPFL
jgi:glycosyltransferase involved in cell wall biosynthesis